MTTPTVSLVIPNWNGLVHLKGCFDAIARQTLQPLETIMVDNGSTDGSFEFVRQRYPHIHIIALSSNHGFAYAVNRGIEAARGEFIGLLNNDTDLDDHWLERLVTALKEDQGLGSAACKMLNFYNRSMIDSAGDGLTPYGSVYNRGHGEHDGSRFHTQELVFGACAGASLYRKDVFKGVGPFDEDFVSFFEDVDMSLRLQLAGFKCIYVPDAVCYHKRGATGGKASAYPVKMTERNLLAFYVKSFPLPLLLSMLPFIIAGTIRRIFRAVLAGLGGPALTGYLEGLRLMPGMIRKRSLVQSTRKVDISYLKSLMRKND